MPATTRSAKPVPPFAVGDRVTLADSYVEAGFALGDPEDYSPLKIMIGPGAHATVSHLWMRQSNGPQPGEWMCTIRVEIAPGVRILQEYVPATQLVARSYASMD